MTTGDRTYPVEGVREQFRVSLGAWNPIGSPPAGMPGDAINLANHGAVASLAIVSVPFTAAWVEALTAESLTTPFGPSDVAIDVGIPTDTTKFTAAAAPATFLPALVYPSATLETQLQVTVHAAVGLLSSLTSGQMVLNILLARWTPSIRRQSP